MKKITQLIGFGMIMLLSFTLNAQTNSNQAPESIINKFFQEYSDKGSDKALEYLFSTNKWMDESKSQIDNIKFKLAGTIKLIGDYYGYEPITSSSIGKNLKLYTYLVKYDRQPLRFSILLYKPDDKWRLQNFSYDDNLDDELEEAAKAYRLEENIPGIY